MIFLKKTTRALVSVQFKLLRAALRVSLAAVALYGLFLSAFTLLVAVAGFSRFFQRLS